MSNLQWYSYYTSNKNVIISEFGWGPVLIYFNYPYEERDEELKLKSIIFIKEVDNQITHPASPYYDCLHVLKNIQMIYNTDLLGYIEY